MTDHLAARALALLTEIAGGCTVEEAQAEADLVKDSPDLNEGVLAHYRLEAAKILALVSQPATPAKNPGCGTCGQPVRKPRPEDGLDPRDFELVHEDGNPICDGPPVAYLA